MNEQQIDGIPEGWRIVRVGRPKANEWILSVEGEPYLTKEQDYLFSLCTSKNTIILEKIIYYKKPTQEDIGKIVEVNATPGSWKEAELLAILPEDIKYRYIYRDTNNWLCADQCRVSYWP